MPYDTYGAVVNRKMKLITELVTIGVPTHTASKIVNDAYWFGWDRGYDVARMESEDV